MRKGLINKTACFLLAVCAAFAFSACGETAAEPCVTHSWDEGAVTRAATCGEHGLKTYTCTVCGETKTERWGEATGEHAYDGNVCTVCGYTDMSGLSLAEAVATYGYYHIDRDGSNTVTAGDAVYFGSYPQSRVTDAALLATLGADGGEWTDYGYYANGERKEGMASYKDVAADGGKYRAVKIEENRPSRSDGTSENSYAAENGYTAGNVYWFKYEPVEWRVLDYENGEALLNAVKCLDAQAYRNAFVKEGTMYYADESKAEYANNWEKSDVRSWLNGAFFNGAFSSSEQAAIVSATLDNRNTGYDASSKYASGQNDTTDKVFLLSYADILNANYGFPANVTGSGHQSIEDLTVCKTGTDYANCQGLRTSVQSANANGEPCSWWMLRSAGGTSFSLCGVSKYGYLSKSNTATFTDEDAVIAGTNAGISPAIKLKTGK